MFHVTLRKQFKNRHMKKTACIFGSTGLVGSYLLEQLIHDDTYQKIIVFNRRKTSIQNPKIEQIIDDYQNIANYSGHLVADDFFCCLGTTMKKAKTKPAFEYVDYHLPLEIGNIALANKVKNYLIVSSVGASSQSSNFYLRTKGGMEEAIFKLEIGNIFIFRPSMLLGNRNESRLLESATKPLACLLGLFMFGRFSKYKPIHGRIVAKAMVKSTDSLSGRQIIEFSQMIGIANEKGANKND
jgi:uncharacterized protein YbjT (DUF2867 family)